MRPRRARGVLWRSVFLARRTRRAPPSCRTARAERARKTDALRRRNAEAPERRCQRPGILRRPAPRRFLLPGAPRRTWLRRRDGLGRCGSVRPPGAAPRALSYAINAPAPRPQRRNGLAYGDRPPAPVRR